MGISHSACRRLGKVKDVSLSVCVPQVNPTDHEANAGIWEQKTIFWEEGHCLSTHPPSSRLPKEFTV